MVHSAEQVADGIILLIQKVLGARTVLTSDVVTGSQTLHVDNTFHFKDAESVVLIDIDQDHVEYHSILQIIDTNTVSLVNPVQSNFTVANQGTLHKALGNVPLSSDMVLFGDRMVIPNTDVAITVEPRDMSDIEWVVIPGGLSVQYNVVVTAYVKLDETENAHRVAMKYGDALFDLFVTNVHLDVVNDEVFLPADVSTGDTEIVVTSTSGWGIDTLNYDYELQDTNHADTHFKIVNILSGPPRVVLNRPVSYDFKVSDRALLRRRVRYIYNSLVSNVQSGFIQKGSAMYKAAQITWWGKETGDVSFDQTSHGGIT